MHKVQREIVEKIPALAPYGDGWPAHLKGTALVFTTCFIMESFRFVEAVRHTAHRWHSMLMKGKQRHIIFMKGKKTVLKVSFECSIANAALQFSV